MSNILNVAMVMVMFEYATYFVLLLCAGLDPGATAAIIIVVMLIVVLVVAIVIVVIVWWRKKLGERCM